MDFRTKNRIFYGIEKMPFSHTLHYALQKYVTHSVDHSDKERLSLFGQKVQTHLDAFAAFDGRPLKDSTYYEFGCGWDLFAPLGFSAAGMQSLICVDIEDHAHAQDITGAAQFYARHGEELGVSPIEDAALPAGKEALRQALLQRYRIRYNAPCDARDTRLDAQSVDYIVSNFTLEHIPPQDIARILAECARLLRHGGVMSCTVDYQDHWSYADPSISVYNFLSFEPEDWRKLNPDLHFQNRLRHSDYLRLFEQSGLEICGVKTAEIRDADREALSKIPLASPFLDYSTDDLLIRSAHFVLRNK